jgi:hypothetical protein
VFTDVVKFMHDDLGLIPDGDESQSSTDKEEQGLSENA